MSPRHLRPHLDSVSVRELVDINKSLRQFTYEDLRLFTDNFDDGNFIGRTQYCEVYRGKIPRGQINGKEDEEGQIVTVKIWADTVDVPRMPTSREDFNRVNFASKFIQLKDEIALLSNPFVCIHPNLVNLMGWCCEIENEDVGVVYDLDTYDSLHNLVPGEILKWADRIKITVEMASLLKVLHNHQPSYMVLNISSAHIMIDQDFKPILLDFGMLTNSGPTFETNFFPLGVLDYWDPSIGLTGFSVEVDVFSFGVLLMELLYKSTTDRGDGYNIKKRSYLHFRAYDSYVSFLEANGIVLSGTLVDKSLMGDAGFDYEDESVLSMLAVQCVQYEDRRPSMAQVLTILKDLNFFKNKIQMLVV